MAVLKLDGANGVVAYPKKIYTALANGAITVGQCVKIETDVTANPDPDTYGAAGFVVTATVGSNSPLCIGVAVSGAADGETVEVQVAGFNSDVTSVEAITLGDAVGSSASGLVRQWDTETAAAQPFAVCVLAFAGADGNGTIMIIDKGWMG